MTPRRGIRSGQGLVEAALVLLVFFALLLGVVDFGQALFARESLVERVRSAMRWGVVHPWQGPDPVRNLVLYGQTKEPNPSREGYLGMTPANVEVMHRPPTPDRPDDETLTIAIVNFKSQFFAPWMPKFAVSARPVQMSAPVSRLDH